MPDGGVLEVLAEDVGTAKRALDADLMMRYRGPGVRQDPYMGRLNFMSISSRESWGRELGRFFGHGTTAEWTDALNRIGVLIRQTFRAHDPAVDLDDIPDRLPEQRWRIRGLLEEGQPTIFFGDGSTGKSYLAQRIAFSVALGQAFLSHDVQQDPVMTIDAETDPATARFRGSRILAGLGLPWRKGLIHYWPTSGKPLAEMAEAIEKRCTTEGIGLVVYDSAAVLCGGKAEDSDSATGFFNGLGHIGRTALIIAHVNRGGDAEKPFGSAFWHNGARLTWNVQRVQEAGEDSIHIGLYNKKANNVRLFRPLAFRIDFEGEDGPVTVSEADLAAVPEFEERLPHAERITRALMASVNRCLSRKAIAEATGLALDTIDARLRDLRRKERIVELPTRDAAGQKLYGVATLRVINQ